MKQNRRGGHVDCEIIYTDDKDNTYKLYIDKQGTQRRKYIKYCPDCNKEVLVAKHKLNNFSRCSKCSYKYLSTPERNSKIGETLRNKYKTDAEWKKKVLAAKVVNRGADHWNWKGGITPLTQRTRTSEESNAWKLAVLYRDNFECRVCKIKDKLHAHHINSWAEFPEDRFILENGLTLCKSCHDFYHLYEKEVRKNANQAKQL